MEADFNTALKILYAKQLMWNAETAALSNNQWGGRANRSAPDCATRKLLTWENARLNKRTVASFFGDLASCFNRMKTNVSTMVAREKGMPLSVCVARSRVVQTMRRRVRTAAGTSSVSYGEETGDIPLAGEIQGKGDVMGLWAIVSDSILSVHHRRCPGITLEHVATDALTRRTADSYVDDTDNYAAATGAESYNVPDPDDPSLWGTSDEADDPATQVVHDLGASAQL